MTDKEKTPEELADENRRDVMAYAYKDKDGKYYTINQAGEYVETQLGTKLPDGTVVQALPDEYNPVVEKVAILMMNFSKVKALPKDDQNWIMGAWDGTKKMLGLDQLSTPGQEVAKTLGIDKITDGVGKLYDGAMIGPHAIGAAYQTVATLFDQLGTQDLDRKHAMAIAVAYTSAAKAADAAHADDHWYTHPFDELVALFKFAVSWVLDTFHWDANHEWSIHKDGNFSAILAEEERAGNNKNIEHEMKKVPKIGGVDSEEAAKALTHDGAIIQKKDGTSATVDAAGANSKAPGSKQVTDKNLEEAEKKQKATPKAGFIKRTGQELSDNKVWDSTLNGLSNPWIAAPGIIATARGWHGVRKGFIKGRAEKLYGAESNLRRVNAQDQWNDALKAKDEAKTLREKAVELRDEANELRAPTKKNMFGKIPAADPRKARLKDEKANAKDNEAVTKDKLQAEHEQKSYEYWKRAEEWDQGGGNVKPGTVKVSTKKPFVSRSNENTRTEIANMSNADYYQNRQGINKYWFTRRLLGHSHERLGQNIGERIGKIDGWGRKVIVNNGQNVVNSVKKTQPAQKPQGWDFKTEYEDLQDRVWQANNPGSPPRVKSVPTAAAPASAPAPAAAAAPAPAAGAPAPAANPAAPAANAAVPHPNTVTVSVNGMTVTVAPTATAPVQAPAANPQQPTTRRSARTGRGSTTVAQNAAPGTAGQGNANAGSPSQTHNSAPMAVVPGNGSGNAGGGATVTQLNPNPLEPFGPNLIEGNLALAPGHQATQSASPLQVVHLAPQENIPNVAGPIHAPGTVNPTASTGQNPQASSGGAQGAGNGNTGTQNGAETGGGNDGGSHGGGTGKGPTSGGPTEGPVKANAPADKLGMGISTVMLAQQGLNLMQMKKNGQQPTTMDYVSFGGYSAHTFSETLATIKTGTIFNAIQDVDKTGGAATQSILFIPALIGAYESNDANRIGQTWGYGTGAIGTIGTRTIVKKVAAKMAAKTAAKIAAKEAANLTAKAAANAVTDVAIVGGENAAITATEVGIERGSAVGGPLVMVATTIVIESLGKIGGPLYAKYFGETAAVKAAGAKRTDYLLDNYLPTSGGNLLNMVGGAGGGLGTAVTRLGDLGHMGGSLFRGWNKQAEEFGLKHTKSSFWHGTIKTLRVGADLTTVPLEFVGGVITKAGDYLTYCADKWKFAGHTMNDSYTESRKHHNVVVSAAISIKDTYVKTAEKVIDDVKAVPHNVGNWYDKKSTQVSSWWNRNMPDWMPGVQPSKPAAHAAAEHTVSTAHPAPQPPRVDQPHPGLHEAVVNAHTKAQSAAKPVAANMATIQQVRMVGHGHVQRSDGHNPLPHTGSAPTVRLAQNLT